MKTSVALLLFLLLYACTSKTNIFENGVHRGLKKKLDTVIIIRDMPEELLIENYIDKEYFVTLKNDTSSLSCFVTKHKVNSEVSMQFRLTPLGKTPDSFSSDDTVAVAKQEPRHKYAQPSYDSQILEIKVILNQVSKDFDLSKLTNVSFSLSETRLAQSLTRQYLNRYGKSFTSGSNKKLAELIKHSKITADLTKVLDCYSIIISDISVDGMFYYIPQDASEVTEPIIDGIIIFNLVPAM